LKPRGPFRAHPRHKLGIRALAVHLDAGWQRHVVVEDLGLGGARISVDEALGVGDAITLSLTAPTLWDPLVLRARVAWSAGDGAPPRSGGVVFELPSGDAALALYELIAGFGAE
jgi:Tfp pilus assembly protein PilZ